jgi:hypothetical protein
MAEHRVFFSELVRANCMRAAPGVTPPDGEAHWTETEYIRVFQCFEAANGRVVRSYFGRDDWVGAALTEHNGGRSAELWFDASPVAGRSAAADDLLLRCDMLRAEAGYRLGWGAKREFLEILFAVVAYTLASLERTVDAPPTAPSNGRVAPAAVDRRAEALAVAEAALARAEAYLDRSSQDRRLLGYSLAMLGVAAVVVAAPVAKYVFDDFDGAIWITAFGPYNGDLLLSAVAGGVGATVSVLIRMTRGKLVLKSTAPMWLTVVWGGARVLVGAVFGVAVLALVKSGLLPIDLPTRSGSDEIVDRYFYFVASIAFIAGFSERFAQDSLARAEATLAADAPDRDAEVAPATSSGSESTTPTRVARHAAAVARRPRGARGGFRRSL